MQTSENFKIYEKNKYFKKLNIIDVTLRDGAHQVDFNWDTKYAKNHIKTIIKSKDINYVELGYWKQTSKSTNPYYNMDEKFLNILSNSKSLFKKISLMVDCHYCSHNPNDYPSKNEYGIGLFRVCSRSEDIDKATKLGESIKNRTGSKLSMNFFNITNYSDKDLKECIQKASDAGADFIYLADTHGTLDLINEFEKYSNLAKMIKEKNIIPGFHLHDHSGKAYMNFRLLPYVGFGSTDVSLSGMGKGDGNLKLEHVIKPEENQEIFDLLEENRSLLTMNPTSFGILSSFLSITDYYALEAQQKNLKPSKFYELAKSIKGIDKDNYKKGLLI